ncbi:recombinase family protein [Amycolatopsis thermoflava]
METTTGPRSPIRCAIYLRISLDATGEQLAIQRQREDCQRIAEQRGWQIVAEFVDNSVSASDRRRARPGYDRLVEAYQAGQFDALVCWDLDRLTRQPRQLEDWIEAAEERGLLLVTANGEADLSTDAGQLFARIKASVARSEVQRKAARQRRAAAQRAEMGKPPLGVRLTGYTVSGELIGEEAKIVRKVFDRFAAGDSLRSLAAWLTDSGVPTRRGHAWNPSSVRTMLTNPRYAGRAVYQGREIGKRGTWEAIVPDDTFAVVQARLADPRRKTNGYGTDRKHLGAGLYRCGMCESPVVSWSGNRYRCPSGCITRAQRGIDTFVTDHIRARLGAPDLADLLPLGESGEATEAQEEVARLRARLDRIGEDYDSGLIDGRRYQVATAKVQAELAGAEAALARLSANTGAASLLLAADPVAAFEASPLMIRRNVIDMLAMVFLLPAPRGRRTFDEASVVMLWRKSLAA